MKFQTVLITDKKLDLKMKARLSPKFRRFNDFNYEGDHRFYVKEVMKNIRCKTILFEHTVVARKVCNSTSTFQRWMKKGLE